MFPGQPPNGFNHGTNRRVNGNTNAQSWISPEQFAMQQVQQLPLLTEQQRAVLLQKRQELDRLLFLDSQATEIHRMQAMSNSYRQVTYPQAQMTYTTQAAPIVQQAAYPVFVAGHESPVSQFPTGRIEEVPTPQQSSPSISGPSQSNNARRNSEISAHHPSRPNMPQSWSHAVAGPSTILAPHVPQASSTNIYTQPTQYSLPQYQLHTSPYVNQMQSQPYAPPQGSASTSSYQSHQNAPGRVQSSLDRMEQNSSGPTSSVTRPSDGVITTVAGDISGLFIKIPEHLIVESSLAGALGPADRTTPTSEKSKPLLPAPPNLGSAAHGSIPSPINNSVQKATLQQSTPLQLPKSLTSPAIASALAATSPVTDRPSDAQQSLISSTAATRMDLTQPINFLGRDTSSDAPVTNKSLAPGQPAPSTNGRVPDVSAPEKSGAANNVDQKNVEATKDIPHPAHHSRSLPSSSNANDSTSSTVPSPTADASQPSGEVGRVPQWESWQKSLQAQKNVEMENLRRQFLEACHQHQGNEANLQHVQKVAKTEAQKIEAKYIKAMQHLLGNTGRLPSQAPQPVSGPALATKPSEQSSNTMASNPVTVNTSPIPFHPPHTSGPPPPAPITLQPSTSTYTQPQGAHPAKPVTISVAPQAAPASTTTVPPTITHTTPVSKKVPVKVHPSPGLAEDILRALAPFRKRKRSIEPAETSKGKGKRKATRVDETATSAGISNAGAVLNSGTSAPAEKAIDLPSISSRPDKGKGKVTEDLVAPPPEVQQMVLALFQDSGPPPDPVASSPSLDTEMEELENTAPPIQVAESSVAATIPIDPPATSDSINLPIDNEPNLVVDSPSSIQPAAERKEEPAASSVIEVEEPTISDLPLSPVVETVAEEVSVPEPLPIGVETVVEVSAIPEPILSPVPETVAEVVSIPELVPSPKAETVAEGSTIPEPPTVETVADVLLIPEPVPSPIVEMVAEVVKIPDSIPLVSTEIVAAIPESLPSPTIEVVADAKSSAPPSPIPPSYRPSPSPAVVPPDAVESAPNNEQTPSQELPIFSHTTPSPEKPVSPSLSSPLLMRSNKIPLFMPDSPSEDSAVVPSSVGERSPPRGDTEIGVRYSSNANSLPDQQFSSLTIEQISTERDEGRTSRDLDEVIESDEDPHCLGPNPDTADGLWYPKRNLKVYVVIPTPSHRLKRQRKKQRMDNEFDQLLDILPEDDREGYEHRARILKCRWNGCPVKLDCVYKLRYHTEQAHLSLDELTCAWRGCQKVEFNSKEELYQHVSEQHLDRLNYCPYEGCEKRSDTIDLLQRHILRSHLDDDESTRGSYRRRIAQPTKRDMPAPLPLDDYRSVPSYLAHWMNIKVRPAKVSKARRKVLEPWVRQRISKVGAPRGMTPMSPSKRFISYGYQGRESTQGANMFDFLKVELEEDDGKRRRYPSLHAQRPLQRVGGKSEILPVNSNKNTSSGGILPKRSSQNHQGEGRSRSIVMTSEAETDEMNLTPSSRGLNHVDDSRGEIDSTRRERSV